MSIQAVSWVLKHERQTAGVERLVLLALANYADEAGMAWPSVKRLAGECNCSERAVQYALAQLVEKGLVSRSLRGATDPRIPVPQRPNMYRLTPPENSAPLGFTGCNLTRDPVQSAASPGAEVAPKTSIEPSVTVSGSAARFEAKPPMEDLRAQAAPKPRKKAS